MNSNKTYQPLMRSLSLQGITNINNSGVSVGPRNVNARQKSLCFTSSVNIKDTQPLTGGENQRKIEASAAFEQRPFDELGWLDSGESPSSETVEWLEPLDKESGPRYIIH